MKKKITIKTPINSLYIHIPFCNNICYYCDFPKLLKNDLFIKPYISSLIKELKSLKINHKLKTIYIGGGTPTSIDLNLILNEVDKYIDKNCEFTIEGNVLDFTDELLKTYISHGVNRISLGVQSTNDSILKTLGRKHNKNDVFNKIDLIKKYIKNINIDLIYGFKELNNKILQEELNDYLKLGVTHISTYSLEIHKGTKFYNEHRKELDDNKIREQYDLIFKALTNNGYKRYEISNFSKDHKFKSKHNINYWKDNQYYAIGLGASSFIMPYRYKNTLNISKYIKGEYIQEKEFISLEDDKKYYLLTNLRLDEGISLKDYEKRFNSSLLEEKKNEINKLITMKLLKIEYTKLVTTYQGSMLLDIILRELF